MCQQHFWRATSVSSARLSTVTAILAQGNGMARHVSLESVTSRNREVARIEIRPKIGGETIVAGKRPWVAYFTLSRKNGKILIRTSEKAACEIHLFI